MARDHTEPTLRIVPDPLEAEREAIAAALARVTPPAGAAAGRTAWWRAGVRESVEPADRSASERRSAQPS